MPVDASIPLGIQTPPQINPLAALSAVQGYRTNQLQQMALGAGIQANQAQSGAIQQNTDDSGNVDWKGATAALAKNPAGAYNLPQFATTAQGLQAGQLGLDTGQQKLAATHAAVGGQIALSILQNNGSPQDFINGVSQAVQDGRLDAKSAMVSIQHAAPSFSDPAAFQGYLKQGLASLPPELQASLQTPALSAVNTGGGTSFVAQNKLTGAPTVTGSVNNTLSPEARMVRVPTIGPNGAAGSVPQGSLAPADLLPPGAAPAQGGNGRYPGAGGAASGAPAVPGVAATPGAPAGFLPTSLAPGVAQAADVVGTDSGKQYVADQQANAGSGQRIYQLQSALTGLQGAGSTGPGTATTNQIASFLQSQVPFGLGKLLPGVDPSKIASYDEANKYLTQYASAKAASLGGGTDAKLATTLSGNASTHISGLAAQDVVKANIGLERLGQAQQDAFAASGLPAAQYTQFASKFGSTVDPRVFVADQMPPAKVAALVQKMNPKEQAQFKAQYNWAVQKGYINGPQ
jgi:hypothetical protein